MRGFALKFYTEEGNWDLVGNNTPVFFVRDPLQVPRLHPHAEAPPARPIMRSPTAMWDFWSLSPGEPASGHDPDVATAACRPTCAHNGYGSHTYSLINAENERFWVKFHFKTQQGHKHTDQRRGRARSSAGPRDRTQGDLFGAHRERRISRAGGSPIQIMPEADAGKTLVQSVRPDQGVAARRLSADRSRRDGIQPQSGKLFRRDRAGRLLAVQHRARHRLLARQDAAGAHLLLCRCPPSSPRHALRDAAGESRRSARCTTITRTGRCASTATDTATSTPITSRIRSTARWRIGRCAEPPLKISGDADRYDHRDGNDDYRQPGDLFRLMSTEAARAFVRQHTPTPCEGVPVEIIKRQVAHFYKADPAYGKGVAARLGLSVSGLPSAVAAE